nr:LUD domain-containing protein [Methanobacterium formicicum]
MENNGIEVIMAHDAEEAREAIYQLVKNEETVAKSKSNTAGEIQLTEYLKEHEVNVLETDLGDRIVQFHQSNPTHPIGPACHLDMEIIAKLVSEEFKKEIEAEPRAILDVVKSDIIEKNLPVSSRDNRGQLCGC